MQITRNPPLLKASISLAILGKILSSKRSYFESFSGQVVTKTAREKKRQHVVLAEKEKSNNV